MTVAPSPIDWERAERVAISVASRQRAGTSAPDPDPASIALASTEVVEDAIERITGLRLGHGTATVQFVDRPTWIRANIASFQTLLSPLLDRWSGRIVGSPGAAMGRQVAGAELGALLGWMSTRVLGQYDILVGRQPSDDAVYLVAPNLASIERRFAFEPAEFRTWVLLHELTHRAQFTGVPWMREYFSGLVEQSLRFADPDMSTLTEAMKSVLRNRSNAAAQVREGGVMGLIATPEQREVLARISGLMSLLEGHGDITMTRAAGDLVPNAARFERILHERRRTANPLSRVVMRLAGIEAKLNQYAAGAHFIETIEAANGLRAVDVCWISPTHLPTMDEIKQPHRWLGRTGALVG
jgi:coenzyme F420 biosynthesis associated uncharacterized protein